MGAKPGDVSNRETVYSVNPMASCHPVLGGEIAPCEHIAQFYEKDSVLLESLIGFVGGGLKAGDSTIVIATAAHLKSLEKALLSSGIDLVSAMIQNRYIALPADQGLRRFMVNQWPDEKLFARFVRDLLTRAQRDGRRVRAFGEMVALLWARGEVAATVRLECLWQELCQSKDFVLFCAYPKAGFTEASSNSLHEICKAHTRVI